MWKDQSIRQCVPWSWHWGQYRNNPWPVGECCDDSQCSCSSGSPHSYGQVETGHSFFDSQHFIWWCFKAVDGKHSRRFTSPRVKQSLLDFLPDYESVIQMDEVVGGLPSYRIAVSQNRID